MKISSLVQPRNEFLIRPLDNVFVTKLKSEILERCSTFVKPLIAVVNNITDKTNFDEKKLHEYVLEVIGGNHRREAYSQLEQEKKLDESQLTVKVQLFTGMFTPYINCLRGSDDFRRSMSLILAVLVCIISHLTTSLSCVW